MNNLESCDVLSSTHFKMAAQLLEVIKKKMLETNFVCKQHTQAHRSDFFLQVAPNALDVSLTQRSLMTNRESVSKPLTSAQAVDGRNAFVKVVQLNVVSITVSFQF